VSSLGGRNHVWSSYYMETMGLVEKVTWIGTGNVDTMLGSLKSKQVDVLVSSLSLLNDSMEQAGAPCCSMGLTKRSGTNISVARFR
jgi:NitT/TauT family transport system substrate-binding protein